MVSVQERNECDRIRTKLGFDLEDLGKDSKNEMAYECDNKPDPFECLTLDELLFIRNRGYTLKY